MYILVPLRIINNKLHKHMVDFFPLLSGCTTTAWLSNMHNVYCIIRYIFVYRNHYQRKKKEFLYQFVLLLPIVLLLLVQVLSSRHLFIFRSRTVLFLASELNFSGHKNFRLFSYFKIQLSKRTPSDFIFSKRSNYPVKQKGASLKAYS